MNLPNIISKSVRPSLLPAASGIRPIFVCLIWDNLYTLYVRLGDDDVISDLDKVIFQLYCESALSVFSRIRFSATKRTFNQIAQFPDHRFCDDTAISWMRTF